ncbi:hypothetical protein V1517DRAFT_334895 [Lipomyces orientalis]|uniref:Uncharacterized protein n=1 Tax=Lipomyces orientalis TaxID=1233043 RepID=A0ACC3TEZ9_9ASCO
MLIYLFFLINFRLSMTIEILLPLCAWPCLTAKFHILPIGSLSCCSRFKVVSKLNNPDYRCCKKIRFVFIGPRCSCLTLLARHPGSKLNCRA